MIFKNTKFEESVIKTIVNRPEAKNETSYKLKKLFKMEVQEKFARKRWKKAEETNENEPEPTVNATTVAQSLNIITDEELLSSHEIVSKYCSNCELTMQVEHEALYIAGRYIKYSRKLPQTPWILDNKRFDHAY